MTMSSPGPGGALNSKVMITGFALATAGGLITLGGIALSASALFAALRRWVSEQPEPPSAMVKRKLAQARAATAAGASAWQDGMAAPRPSR